MHPSTPPRPDLDGIEARAKAASSAPWKACKAEDCFDNWPVCPSMGCDDEGQQWAVSTDGVRASEFQGEGAKADADFIAAARQDVPALVAYARSLEAQVEAERERNIFLGAELETLRAETRKPHPEAP